MDLEKNLIKCQSLGQQAWQFQLEPSIIFGSVSRLSHFSFFFPIATTCAERLGYLATRALRSITSCPSNVINDKHSVFVGYSKNVAFCKYRNKFGSKQVTCIAEMISLSDQPSIGYISFQVDLADLVLLWLYTGPDCAVNLIVTTA